MLKLAFNQVVILLIFLFPFSLLQAQSVPQLINYQGQLTNGSGEALATAEYKLSFKIYDAASGGNLKWGPQVFNAVTVVRGHFNVILGPLDSNSILIVDAFQGSNRYLEITVGNEAPVVPRQQILSTPYAVQAQNSDLVRNVDLLGKFNALSGMVAAFNLNSCPSGWSEFSGAYGRFIRGIDKSGTNIDVDGERGLGSIQLDSFKSHQHKLPVAYAPGGQAGNWSLTYNSPISKPEYAKMQSEGEAETRPKNIALLYCVKD
ncbi:MAG: hypothetical protein KAJ63_06610 [Methyloprofundus sp.]|nr:hypothetical protein [Methyloprofundus sp.]